MYSAAIRDSTSLGLLLVYPTAVVSDYSIPREDRSEDNIRSRGYGLGKEDDDGA